MSAIPASDPSIDNRGWHAGNERRRSRRAPLHWTLYLAYNGAAPPFRSRTRDISSDGFYCLLDHPIRVGDQFECDIVVPTHACQSPEEVFYLRCRAQAVRVEKIGAGAEFGLGCRIEDYSLIHGANVRLGLTLPKNE